jgi:hypothetical protein
VVTAAVRSETPSLPNARSSWVLTVASLMNSCLAAVGAQHRHLAAVPPPVPLEDLDRRGLARAVRASSANTSSWLMSRSTPSTATVSP